MTTEQPFNATMAEIIARGGERTALVTPEGEMVSFDRLEAAIRSVTWHLASRFIGPGDRVLVLTDHPSVRMVVALALLRRGAEVVMISSAASLRAAGLKADAVVRFAEQPDDPTVRSIIFDQSWLAPTAPPPDMREGGTIIYPTSGSTGVPKLIRMRPESYLAVHMQPVFGSGTSLGPVLVGILETAMFSLYLMIRAFVGGHGILWMVPDTAESLKQAERAGVKEMMLTPLALNDLVRAAESGAPAGHLSRITVFGAIAEPGLLQRARAAFRTEVAVKHGATEVGQVAFGFADPATYQAGWCGTIIPKIEAKLVDPDPATGAGRLLLRAPVSDRVEGYIGGAPAFDDDGWFDTGDLALISPDRQLLVVGRADNVINLGGPKVAAERIEEIACGAPGVLLACATQLPAGPDGNPRVGIAIEVGKSFRLNAMRAHLDKTMAVRVHTTIRQVARLPRLVSGKLDRKAVADLFV